MRDRIITLILMLFIIVILGVIGYIAYNVYDEISKDGTIVLKFEGEAGFPTIDYVPSTKETIDAILNDDIFTNLENPTTETSTTQATNPKSTKSRFLYNQLDETAKVIYKKLYQSRDSLKTGTFQVDYGNTFQTLLLKENGEDELKAQYQSAIEALIYENPDIFYLDVTKMYINIEKITKITGTKYNVYINNGAEGTYLSEGFYSKKDIEEYETQIEQVKNKIIAKIQGKSDYDKIKIIHDYLIDTIEYEQDLSQDNVYDIYGALVTKRCVCEGYAKAFQYLMNEIGIENTIVIGTGTNSKNATENHAWNYVKLDGEWYAVDVTWDDPIITGGGILTSKSRYEYFLKGSKTMDRNHYPSGKFTQEGQTFQYPVLSKEDYK